MDNKLLTDILIADSIKRAFSIYGIEGTEDLINRVYNNKETVRNKFLKIYKQLLREV